jgi:Na+-transporting NADH:ubiquinone oxidoreductase subunit C
MAYNKNSNFATFAFAIGMVLVFGTALTVIKIQLKPMQDENERVKKMMDILGAVKIETSRDNAEALFAENITAAYRIQYDGSKAELPAGSSDEVKEAFTVDIKKDFRDRSLKGSDKVYPVYISGEGDNAKYIIPMVGKGLWGPIWGFVSLEADFETIYGVKFDHKTETPGLGAEIKQDMFMDKFNDDDAGRKINKSGTKLFEVLKGGAEITSEYQVDGITGGTITSKGVEEMMDRTIKIYVRHFDSLK